MFRQEFIERNAFLLLVLTLVTIAIGGIIEVTRQQDEKPGADTATRASELRARIDACLEAVGVQVG